MRDLAHALADKELEEIEKRIEEIYRRANAEVEKKAAAYFKRFEALDKQKRALVESGKMTEEAYRKWKQGKIMTGKHWTTLKNQTAEAMNNANNIAADYVNGRVPSVYAINYNQVAKDLTGQVRGISFEMVDAHTVKNLATKDKTLLPYKTVNNVKDVRWNTQKVNSEILQGILQGDSIPNLSKRLRHVTEMNRASSVRNARTAITSAENKGRIDMLHDAEDKGVKAEKGWLAAHDARVRESHAQVDGEFVGIDEEFSNGLQFPGDPDGRPEEVYNCRCTLVYKVVGFGKKSNVKQSTTREAEPLDPVEKTAVKEKTPDKTKEKKEEKAKKTAITNEKIDKMSRSQLEDAAKKIYIASGGHMGYTKEKAEKVFDKLIGSNSTTYLRKYIKKHRKLL